MNITTASSTQSWRNSLRITKISERKAYIYLINWLIKVLRLSYQLILKNLDAVCNSQFHKTIPVIMIFWSSELQILTKK